MMKFEIFGDIAQNARFELSRGQTLWVSRGSLMAFSPNVSWNLRVPGGVTGAFRRSLSGEGIALVFVESQADEQSLILAANQPGHITTWDLEDGPVITTRGSFMAAWGDIEIDVTVARRTGAAFFGGAGLFLQKVSGVGRVLVHGSGDLYEKRLKDGEQILVSTGNLAAFAERVDYDIQGVGGCRKIFFGHEGLFMTRLTGPGRVLLQTLKRRNGRSGSGSGMSGSS